MTEVHLAGPTAPEELRQMFLAAVARPTDIHQHLTVLRDTASGCKHITEIGVGSGQSTLAWLLVQPDKLVCYDLGWQDCIPSLQKVKGRTDFRFFIGHSSYIEIEETDLLFLDTTHNYGTTKEELTLHGNKSRRFILMHDTTTFGDHSEDNKPPGMWQAIEEFMAANPAWQVMFRHTHNIGLTALKRGV